MTNRDMAVLLCRHLLDGTCVWVDSEMGERVWIEAIERDDQGRFVAYDQHGNDRLCEEYLLSNPGRPDSGGILPLYEWQLTSLVNPAFVGRNIDSEKGTD